MNAAAEIPCRERQNDLRMAFADTLSVLALVGLALLNCCGCAVVPVRVGMDDTEIVITSVGVEVQGQLVAPSEVPRILRKTEVPRSRTVHVLVEDGAMKNLTEAKSVLNYLRAGGYVRNTLVTQRMSVSSAQASSRQSHERKENER